MDREKQINEMATDIGEKQEAGWVFVDNSEYTTDVFNKELAEHLVVNKGYRKQSEGKWEKFEGERFICSNCAKVFGLGSTATIYDVKRVWKYCPNCGAKMKGGEE